MLSPTDWISSDHSHITASQPTLVTSSNWTLKDCQERTWSSRDLSLDLETSWDLFLQVSVLVLEPQSLGLGLGLGTLESRSWCWSWDLRPWRLGFSSLMKRKIVRLPPLLLWNRYLATVVCWCGQTGLEWVTTCCQSWSTCDATISCKFLCCCTVGISLYSCMTRNTWTFTF